MSPIAAALTACRSPAPVTVRQPPCGSPLALVPLRRSTFAQVECCRLRSVTQLITLFAVVDRPRHHHATHAESGDGKRVCTPHLSVPIRGLLKRFNHHFERRLERLPDRAISTRNVVGQTYHRKRFSCLLEILVRQIVVNDLLGLYLSRSAAVGVSRIFLDDTCDRLRVKIAL